MKGWITWVGVAQIVISAILRAFGQHEIADVITTTGGATAAIGLGRKIERHRK